MRVRDKSFEQLTHKEKMNRIRSFFVDTDNGRGIVRSTWLGFVFSDGEECRDLYLKYLKYFMRPDEHAV